MMPAQTIRVPQPKWSFSTMLEVRYRLLGSLQIRTRFESLFRLTRDSSLKRTRLQSSSWSTLNPFGRLVWQATATSLPIPVLDGLFYGSQSKRPTPQNAWNIGHALSLCAIVIREKDVPVALYRLRDSSIAVMDKFLQARSLK
ncbi:hypothetical protein TNCV_3433411 [Trichonephila clavipes]|nr:hypothetical protein TNCV_3433411 [Trichonephila clavipes]